MKTIVKNRKIITFVLSVLLGLSVIGAIFSLTRGGVKAFAEASSSVTDGATEITLSDMGLSEDDFKMDLGASVRVNSQTPGIRFSGTLDEDALKTSESYGEANYDYAYYIGFTVDGKTLYVTFTPDEVSGYFSASVTYEGISDANKSALFGKLVKGEGVIVLTPKAEGEKKFVKATANDNVRSVEAVVNAALLNGENEEYPGINDFGFVKESVTLDAVDLYLGGGEIAFTGAESISKVYFGSKLIENPAISGNVLTLEKSAVSAYALGDSFWVSAVDGNGKFYNARVTLAPKTVTTEVWLSATDGVLYAGDGGAAFTAEDGSKIVSATADGETLNVTTEGYIEGFTVNSNKFTEKAITVTTEAGNAYKLVNAKIFTKVLTKASDLAVFNLTSAVSAKGYYIAARDLTDDPAFTNLHPGYANAARFDGVFDGNGHTVTFTASAHGLFGNTDWSAVIKNVAFKNVKTASTSGHGNFLILGHLGYGSLEDVYVSFEDYDSANRGHRTSMFENLANGTLKLKRCVIEIPEASIDTYGYETGAKSYYGPLALYGGTNDITINGSVYVLSKLIPMFSCGFAGKSYYNYAVNDYREGSSSITYKVLNAYRYDNFADMKADTANYNAADFTATVWQNNVIGLTYEASSKKLYDENLNEITAINESAISSYDQTLENATANKILKNITVTTEGGKVYNVAVNVVTKLLKSSSDLAVFNASASDKVISGYYLAANDLTDNPDFFNSHVNRDSKLADTAGFNGTFDGNGKKISYTAYANGLFGNLLSGATVKNAAFVNLKLKAESAGNRSLALCYYMAANVTLRDVYINISDFNTAYKGATTTALANNIGSTAGIKNVIVNLTAPLTDYEFTDNVRTKYNLNYFYGALTVWGSSFASASNIYVITGTKMPLFGNYSSGVETSHKIEIAANDYDATDWTGITYPSSITKIETVFRYNTAVEMKADTANYNSAAFTASVWENVNI